MDDLTSGKPIDFITSDQPRRRRYPDWRQAAEGEHALLVAAEAQFAAATAANARLRGLLGEFVQDEYTYINQEIGYCVFCGLDTWNLTTRMQDHTPDCLVLRARAALASATP